MLFSGRYGLYRDSQESILGIVVCKFIFLVFSGGDSLLFYTFIYFFIYLFTFFFNSVIIIVVIEIFLLGLFCPRLEYLCPELLGVLSQIDDGFNGFSQNPSFGQIDEFS